MRRKAILPLWGGLVALLLLTFVSPPRAHVPAAEANRIRGYTYYWNESKQAWSIARGARVTASKNGQACAETSSGTNGYYLLCLDNCRAPGSPPVELDVEASYQGLRDYYSFVCYGQDEYHDFHMVGEEEIAPPNR